MFGAPSVVLVVLDCQHETLFVMHLLIKQIECCGNSGEVIVDCCVALLGYKLGSSLRESCFGRRCFLGTFSNKVEDTKNKHQQD